MSETGELRREQEYFDLAWDHREARRNAAIGARAEGSRYDVRAYVKTNQDYAEQLAGPDVAVAHGAITLESGEVLYVGRNTITDQSREALVINWKTDVGGLYERASVKDPSGVSVKRTFRTTRNRIDAFDDLVFADLASRVAELSETEAIAFDDALLSDLDAERTGTMRDIVRTIQASQSGLIRHPADALLLIQGGPGTGKSAIALHRVSWLLFNEPGLRPDRTLVVGPNPTFSYYIRDVLPGLGDADVPQTNLRSLGPQTSSRREEAPATTKLKGELRMAELLRRALDLRARFAGSEPALVVGSEFSGLAIERAEIESKISELRATQTYTTGRSSMKDWLTDKVLDLMINASEFTPRDLEVDSAVVDRVLDRLWPSLSPQQFLRDLLGSETRLRLAAGDSFTAADISRLYRQSAPSASSETWSDTDVALLDEAEFLIHGSPERYDHIVVDEAQDLSPMQIRSIARRSSNGHYTVVGDIAQSTGAWARDSWDDVVQGLHKGPDLYYEQLDYGYRVPKEIYEVAAKLLPLTAPGLEPLTVVRSAPEAPRFIPDDGDFDLADETVTAIEEQAVKGRFIGVIVAPEQKEVIAETLKTRQFQFADADSGTLGPSVNLISAAEAKGLEFDSVVVVEPAAIAEHGDRGLRLLYIALTRATKYLTVVYARAFDPLQLEGAVSLDQPVIDTPTEYTPPENESRESVTPNSDGPVQREDSPGRPTGLSPLLAGAARSIAMQIRDDVHRDKWPQLLAEVQRLLDES